MNEQEIDIREIFHILWSRIWIILLALAMGVGAGFAYTYYLVTPMYEAATTVYAGRTISDDTNPDSALYQELLIGEKLVNDYRELVKSRQVAGIVIERMGNGTTELEEISRSLGVVSRTNTRIIEITSRHMDPVKAALIANLTAEVFKERAVEIMDIKNVQIIDEAVVPKNPVVPNKMMNMAISAVLGLMLGILLAFLIEFLDNKIRTKEDVEKELGLPVLGVIQSLEKVSRYNKKNKDNYLTVEGGDR